MRAVEDLSYSVYPGEMVAIVGESGSGKSVSALAVMQLLPPGTARIPKGSVRFDGRELLKLSDEEMRRIRGLIKSFHPVNAEEYDSRAAYRSDYVSVLEWQKKWPEAAEQLRESLVDYKRGEGNFRARPAI